MTPQAALALTLLATPHLLQAAFINLTPVPSPRGSSESLNPSTDPSIYFYVTTRTDTITSVSTPDSSEAPPRLDVRETSEIIDETVKLYSANALRKAKMQLATGNYQAVLDSIDQALTHNPQDPAAITLRGIVSAKKSKFGAAILDYNIAIGYDPSHHEAYHSRAIARSKIKQFDRAIEDFDRVVRLAPTFPDVYHKRGLLHAQLGNFQAALRDFSTYTNLRPDDPVGYNNKVAALMKLDRREEAEAAYEIAKQVAAKATNKPKTQ